MLLRKPGIAKYLINEGKVEFIILFLLCFVIGEIDDNLYLLDQFDLKIPSFIGTAIIIILAFRTNKAYLRWWESKQIWDEIVSNTRVWTRLSINFMDSKKGPEIAKNQIFWCDILQDRLRKTGNYTNLVKKEFNSSESAKILSFDNPNQGILQIQSTLIKKQFEGKETYQYIHVALEDTLTHLEQLMGKCERIKNTTFPPLYDFLIHSTIYLFAIVSAYFIDDNITIFEGSVSFIISSIFLSIHIIAKQLQNPFENHPSDTPMSFYCFELKQELNEAISNPVESVNPYHKGNHIM